MFTQWREHFWGLINCMQPFVHYFSKRRRHQKYPGKNIEGLQFPGENSVAEKSSLVQWVGVNSVGLLSDPIQLMPIAVLTWSLPFLSVAFHKLWWKKPNQRDLIKAQSLPDICCATVSMSKNPNQHKNISAADPDIPAESNQALLCFEGLFLFHLITLYIRLIYTELAYYISSITYACFNLHNSL